MTQQFFKMADSSFKENACFVFQKYYKGLSTGLAPHLPVLAAHLYSSLLITCDNRNRILDINGTSQLERCMCLLNDVEERIKRDHTPFEKFCQVLCSQEVGLSDLGDPMLRDFQQLCEKSRKPMFHGSYVNQQIGNNMSKSAEPTSESQSEAIDEGTPLARSSRSTFIPATYSSSPPLVKSFGTPQQALSSGSDDTGEQVVPVKESTLQCGTTGCPLTQLDLNAGVGCYSARRLNKAKEQEEKRLVSDAQVLWDTVKDCENCAETQEKYSRILEDMKKYYEKQLEDGAAELARVKLSEKKLLKQKEHLLETVDIQSEDKMKRLKETENEIIQLSAEVDRQRRELQAKERQLNEKIKEQEMLRSTMSSKEKKLHEMCRDAKCCPIYSDGRKLDVFRKRAEMCTQIQSLVVRFFSSRDPGEKSNLRDEIQTKLSRFSFLRKRRSFSL